MDEGKGSAFAVSRMAASGIERMLAFHLNIFNFSASFSVFFDHRLFSSLVPSLSCCRCCIACVRAADARAITLVASVLLHSTAQTPEMTAQAEKLLRRALVLEPGHTDAIALLVNLMTTSGQHQAAIDMYVRIGAMQLLF